MKRSRQIDGQRFLPSFRRERFDRRKVPDHRVIHQDIEPTESVDRRRNDSLHIDRVACVTQADLDLAAGLRLREMPAPEEAARPTRMDLKKSPALSILLNGPKSFSGRKVGALSWQKALTYFGS